MSCRLLLLLLILGLSLTPIGAHHQDPPPKQDPPKTEAQDVMKFETNLVVLNVTVTDGSDRYVPGLKRDDFKIFEDKVPQTIVDFNSAEKPFAVAILLDTSLSMQSKLTLARAACAKFVEGLREGDTFAIYSFGGMKVKLMQEFTEIRDVPDSVWDLKVEGETPLYDAITQSADALAQRSERRRAILVVSDGADTKSKATLDQALRKTLDAQASIYAVDLSDASVYKSQPRDTGAQIMKEMAAKTGGKFYPSAGGSELRDAFTKTIDELRQQYTLTYESTNEKYDGKWRVVEVKVAKPLVNVRTRQGYYAKKQKS
ncbi:MAG: VWA domain-containing protein [Acidobacteria bacterium]|nr:VWA domain-containing protein [Acidobacteriota bacterium]